MNISSLDVDDIVKRFINLRSMDVKPENLNAYARRFKLALESFLQYKRDPSNWKPRGHMSSNRKPKLTKFNRAKGSQVYHDTAELAVSDVGVSASLPLVDYPFPLRDNCIVRLKLPSDLKIADVERLTAFMRTLALDFTSSRNP